MKKKRKSNIKKYIVFKISKKKSDILISWLSYNLNLKRDLIFLKRKSMYTQKWTWVIKIVN
jgi:hypothetical protein